MSSVSYCFCTIYAYLFINVVYNFRTRTRFKVRVPFIAPKKRIEKFSRFDTIIFQLRDEQSTAKCQRRARARGYLRHNFSSRSGTHAKPACVHFSSRPNWLYNLLLRGTQKEKSQFWWWMVINRNTESHREFPRTPKNVQNRMTNSTPFITTFFFHHVYSRYYKIRINRFFPPRPLSLFPITKVL